MTGLERQPCGRGSLDVLYGPLLNFLLEATKCRFVRLLLQMTTML